MIKNMKTFRLDEIVNKHGKHVSYFSKAEGRTDLEKFKNSFIYDKNCKEYVVEKNGDRLTCFVEYNETSDGSNDGWFAKVFNSNGELIEDSFPGLELEDSSLEALEIFLEENL
jgi:hypothetical protein